jgi:transcriptional regulator with XRE-family HTH domain
MGEIVTSADDQAGGSLPASSRRTALSQFLKSCRARVTPGDVGLPEPDRRRTPGLRREDVAALSGVSVTWYTWLEQGRDMGVSTDVLERVSATLRLSEDEREYLFELVQNRPPPLSPNAPETVTPVIERLLNALRVPAYVITMRWDVLAWNTMCAKVLRDYGELPTGQRNLLKILFSGGDYPIGSDEYHAMARRLVAKLRVDYSQFPGDTGIEALVAELAGEYPTFRDLWGSVEVSGRSEGQSVAHHPKLGDISLEHTSFMPEGRPTLRLVMFAPADADSAEKLTRLADEI